MKIGELSKKTGLSRDTIRFYERNKLIQSRPGTSETNSYRDYPEHLVEQLQFISQARDAGMTVAELGDLFETMRKVARGREQGKQVVKDKIEELKERISQTRKVIKFLENAVKKG